MRPAVISHKLDQREADQPVFPDAYWRLLTMSGNWVQATPSDFRQENQNRNKNFADGFLMNWLRARLTASHDASSDVNRRSRGRVRMEGVQSDLGP